MRIPGYSGRQDKPKPFAVILGSNDIASAVAVYLSRRGYDVVLSHDASAPVLRRKMAFHDALFDEQVTLGGMTALRVDNGLQVLMALGEPGRVLITELGLLDLIILRSIDLLVDARMQKYQMTPDLRRLAALTIGVGPGFSAGETCHVAVETLPERAGEVILHGPTCPPDGIPRKLGQRGSERFMTAPFAGRWHTAIEIGTRVYKDFVIGFVGENAVQAPFDGTLRGLVRDGTEVQAGAKLGEIDPRARAAIWCGIDSRAHMIAEGVIAACTAKSSRRPHLVR
jgi:biotin carboxyl carrier protein